MRKLKSIKFERTYQVYQKVVSLFVFRSELNNEYDTFLMSSETFDLFNIYV